MQKMILQAKRGLHRFLPNIFRAVQRRRITAAGLGAQAGLPGCLPTAVCLRLYTHGGMCISSTICQLLVSYSTICNRSVQLQAQACRITAACNRKRPARCLSVRTNTARAGWTASTDACYSTCIAGTWSWTIWGPAAAAAAPGWPCWCTWRAPGGSAGALQRIIQVRQTSPQRRYLPLCDDCDL